MKATCDSSLIPAWVGNLRVHTRNLWLYVPKNYLRCLEYIFLEYKQAGNVVVHNFVRKIRRVIIYLKKKVQTHQKQRRVNVHLFVQVHKFT